MKSRLIQSAKYNINIHLIFRALNRASNNVNLELVKSPNNDAILFKVISAEHTFVEHLSVQSFSGTTNKKLSLYDIGYHLYANNSI